MDDAVRLEVLLRDLPLARHLVGCGCEDGDSHLPHPPRRAVEDFRDVVAHGINVFAVDASREPFCGGWRWGWRRASRAACPLVRAERALHCVRARTPSFSRRGPSRPAPPEVRVG